MTPLFFIIILILFASLVIPTLQNAQAIPYMSPQDLYKQSDMVFHGQVISKQIGPGPDFFYYQVKVDTYFKNPQTSDSITVAGHKSSDTHMAYPQFEVGDKAIFYISKLEGINTISPFSTKAGEACNIHAFLGSAPIQGEPIARNPGIPLALLDENGSMVGSSLTNHPVFLTYSIVNNYPFSKNFTLEAFVEDQNDTSITFYKKQVLELGACESTGDALKWSFVPTKSGTYSLNVNIDGQFRLGYGFQVTDAHSASNPNSQVVYSPLQQFKSGIAANDVKCEQGLQLVIKAEDNSPACVKLQTAQKLVELGWGWVMQTIDSIKPLMPNRIMGLGNDTGIVTLQNQTYYFETANYTDTAFSNPVQISFHDVVFTLFPSGFKGGLPTDFGGVETNGCSGSYFWTDAKFLDGIHVVLHIFAITTMSQHCQVLPAPTDFSTHTNPQAGLTFYDGKMKLLVSTSVANSTSNGPEFKVGPDLLGPIPHQLVFFMKSNSTAKIFVEYTSNEPNTGTMPSYSSVYVGKENYTPLTTSDVTINAYPSSISLTEGSNTTVVYAITAKEGVKGVYWIFLTQFCKVMPLAVDMNSLTISPSDIPVQMGTMYCPAQSLNGKILGISGGTAEYKIGQPVK